MNFSWLSGYKIVLLSSMDTLLWFNHFLFFYLLISLAFEVVVLNNMSKCMGLLSLPLNTVMLIPIINWS
jgi:hypothetical protein